MFRKDKVSKISVRLQPLVRNSNKQISLSLPPACFKIIAASSLRGCLTVFSSRAYDLLPYTKMDSDIFYSSPEWEKAALGSSSGTGAHDSSAIAASSLSPKMEAQLSQDY
jgi:hypothetical protein